MKVFRVWLDLENWPAGTPECQVWSGNHHSTGPDGTLFITNREQRDGGVDFRTGMSQVTIESRHVITLRGGPRPLWRTVETIEGPEDMVADEIQQKVTGPAELPDELPWPQRGTGGPTL